jgi:Ca-activated chloride channel homolog
MGMMYVAAIEAKHPRWLRWSAVLVMGLAVAATCAWAWNAAGGDWANLWLSPDQQGDRLMARGDFAEAAKRYKDPAKHATALYRAGEFKEAAAAFGRIDTAVAAYDRGNALLMTGKYADAITSYDRALAVREDWQEAVENRELADARRRALEPPKDDAGGTGGQLDPDDIVFDNRAKSADPANQEVAEGGPLSDEQVQAMWLRRVQTKPADFLRAKFAYQLSREEATPSKNEDK